VYQKLNRKCVMFPAVFRLEGDKVGKSYKLIPSNPDKTIQSDISG
jgi:hypothetical protein